MKQPKVNYKSDKFDVEVKVIRNADNRVVAVTINLQKVKDEGCPQYKGWDITTTRTSFAFTRRNVIKTTGRLVDKVKRVNSQWQSSVSTIKSGATRPILVMDIEVHSVSLGLTVPLCNVL